MRDGSSTTALDLLLVGLFIFGYSSATAQTQGAGVPSASCESGLSLRISTPETTSEVDRAVPLHLEIQNCSQKEVWIGLSYEEVLGSPVNFPVVVRDMHRRPVLPGVIWFHESPFGRPGPSQWWVRLAPPSVYARDITLTRYQSAFVMKSGKYQITASYTGISNPRLASNPRRELSNAPPQNASVFTERVESNSISIEI